MWQKANEAYAESSLLSADPVALVRLCYRNCAEAVREARRHLAKGEIRERSRSISRASGILVELAATLDHRRGGEIALQLARLYDYMLRRLNEANLRQADEPLGEVLALLATLTEAWDGVIEALRPAVTPVKETWTGHRSYGPALAMAERSWSF
ncbi:MAG: flagellar export chaperone FliS [Bryobacteraceae bacterium]|jgi:flagellar protein FliS